MKNKLINQAMAYTTMNSIIELKKVFEVFNEQPGKLITYFCSTKYIVRLCYSEDDRFISRPNQELGYKFIDSKGGSSREYRLLKLFQM